MKTYLPPLKEKLRQGLWFDSLKFLSPAIVTLLMTVGALAQLPVVTVRFANPQYNCATQTYCLDVEFQSNTADKQLYGMNVRFFYDDAVLEYESMGNFETGYSAVAPSPPQISTGNAGSGALLFGFPANHPFEFVNGAIQLTGTSSLMISTTSWTRVFSVCFHVDDPAALNVGSFCPSLVWDLEYNPANGGWLAGDDGIVITVVAPPPVFSSETTEADVHFNWQFDASPEVRPYGNPVSITCISTQGITASASATDATCHGGSNGTATAMPANGIAPYAYTWSDGQTTATATGLTAGTYYVTVTDGNACSATTSATVGQPLGLAPGTAGSDQTICANTAPLAFSATPPTGGTGTYAYQWESSTNGTGWNPVSGATNLSFTSLPLAVSTSFRLKQYSVGCSDFAFTNTVAVTVVVPVTAVVNPDQYLCGQYTTVLAGTWPTAGNTADWALFSGPSAVTLGPPNSPYAVASGLIGSPVPYVFRYTLTTNASGISCTSQADAYVYNYAFPSSAYAGADQDICLSAGLSTATTLNANLPASGQGRWSQYAGPSAALFADPLNHGTIVSNLVEGAYTFFWKIGNGVCDSTYDAVIVNVHTPAIVAVGNDTTICGSLENLQVYGTASNYTSLVWTTSGTGHFNNCGSLDPVYTFSNADILAGHVTLTLTAHSQFACDDVSASMNITLQAPPMANAGQDATICESSTNYVCNATASNYTSFFWSTTGTGFFNDIHILDPVYIPSQADIDAGCVFLVLHVQGIAPCAEVTDTMKLCINRIPVAYAGPDDLICQGSSYLLSLASVEHAGYITWTSSGNGTFSDPHIVQPVYNLTPEDIVAGSVVLTMNVLGMSPCPNTSDAMTLYIHPSPSVSLTVTNATCYSAANGQITASVTGGTPPYSYLWSNGQTTSVATGLAAGSYSVTVTDSFGCKSIASATVTEPEPLWLGGFVFDVACFGGNDGEVMTLVFGGTAPYSYLWSNGQTTDFLSGLTAGAYTVTVTDVNACMYSKTFTVAEPSQISATASVTGAACHGQGSGSIQVTPSGGTAPYQFLWDNGQTTAAISALVAGSYTVTITDDHTCERAFSYAVGEPSAQTLSATTTPVACNGGSDGAIDVTNGGGTPPYYYAWSNGLTTQDIGNLVAGSYGLTITDANSCDISQSWNIDQPGALVTDAVVTPIFCYGATNGAIDLSVTGGTLPYTFRWSNGMTTEDLSGLAAGTYLVTVTDNHLCKAFGSWAIDPPPFWEIGISGPEMACENSTDNQYCALVEDPAHPLDLYSYQWVVTGGFITSGQNDECITVTWPPCSNGTVTLIVTRLSDGCTLTTSTQVVVTPNPDPIISGPVQVASGTTAVQYCTPFVPGHLYSWSVIGGAVVAGQGTNCITVDWGPYPACGCGQVVVTETFNGCSGSFTLPVSIIPGDNTSIAGYVLYDNEQQSALNGVTVELRNSAGYVVGNVVTQNNTSSAMPGYYAFTGLTPGNYHLRASFNGEWNGNNATDALIIQMNVLGDYPLAFLKDSVANVNGSFNPRVSALDALYVKLRTVGSISSYPAGDWKLTDTTVVFNGTVLPVNLKALCVGDVNASYVPDGLKQAPLLYIEQDGLETAAVGEPFNLELRSGSDAGLGAMTLYLGYDNDRFEVMAVESNLDELKYTIGNGKISIAWADTKPLAVKSSQAIFSFKIKAKQNIPLPEQIFSLRPASEFADIYASPFSNFELRMASVVTPGKTDGITLLNYPNPFRNNTTIAYSLPKEGHVKLTISNLYGQTIKTLEDKTASMGSHSVFVDPAELNIPAGIYIYKLCFEADNMAETKTNKMVFTR